MFQIVFVFFVMFFTLINCLYVPVPVGYRPCRTHDSCVRMTDCPPYMSLFSKIKRPLTQNSLLFLRHQECGFDGVFPLVCCLTINKIPQVLSQESDEFVPQPAPSYNLRTDMVQTSSTTSMAPNFNDRLIRTKKQNTKPKREKDLKLKMQAINEAFTFHSIDDFFVRRISPSKTQS